VPAGFINIFVNIDTPSTTFFRSIELNAKLEAAASVLGFSVGVTLFDVTLTFDIPGFQRTGEGARRDVMEDLKAGRIPKSASDTLDKLLQEHLGKLRNPDFARDTMYENGISAHDMLPAPSTARPVFAGSPPLVRDLRDQSTGRRGRSAEKPCGDGTLVSCINRDAQPVCASVSEDVHVVVYSAVIPGLPVPLNRRIEVAVFLVQLPLLYHYFNSFRLITSALIMSVPEIQRHRYQPSLFCQA
jgi:hypothetical protein